MRCFVNYSGFKYIYNSYSLAQLLVPDSALVPSHTSFSTSLSIASGVVVEAQRWTTLPSLSMRNFSKFHYNAVEMLSHGKTQNTFSHTYLDTGKTKEARLLLLEVLVDLARVVAVDVRLLHQGERDAVVLLAELGDLVVSAWLLTTKLQV